MPSDDGGLARVLRDGDLRAYYLAFAALAFVWEVYGRALPLLFEQVGLSLALLGLARSAGSGLALVAEPVSGLLADRVDRAGMAAVAMLAVGAVLALVPLAPAGVLLVALVALAPPARQFVTNAVTPAVDAAVESGAEGRGWALRDVGLYGGAALGAAVAGVSVVAAGDVAAAFPPLGIVMALGAAALWRRHEGGLDGEGLLATALEGLRGGDPVGAFRSVSSWALLGRFCAVEGLAVLGGGMSLFLLPVYAVAVGVPADAVLFVFAAYNLLAVPASLYGGRLADRRSRRRLYVANYASEAAMLLAFGLAAGGPGRSRTLALALFGLGLALYAAQTAFGPAVLAYFFDQFPPEEAGRAWSVEGTVAKAAGLVAPAVGGALYTVAPRLPFLVGGALLSASAAVALTLPGD